jgi:hypothetical protein
MSVRIEVFTAAGVTTGVVARPGPIRGILDGSTDVVVESSRWLPLDGSGESDSGDVRFAVDDLLLVFSDEAEGLPVHAQWHEIDLDAGPYRVHGEMPTMPGFDPGRALARPTGEFVLLRDARIQLIDREEAGEASFAHLLVNRYTVDRIAADLMLGFFFPGAELTVTGSPADDGATTSQGATTSEGATTSKAMPA